MHSHSHGTGRVLSWSTAITLAFVVFEAAAGWRAHSLALLSDAGHNFTDAIALVLAAAAYRVQARPANETKTYGYQRAGVVAAFVNALTLAALSLWILWEGWNRLFDPGPVDDRIMLVVAAMAVVLNGVIVLGLHRGRSDINVKAAYIHMLGDAAASVAIIAGAIVIRFTGWRRIDPLLSVLIAAMIVWTAWDIIRESLNVLLEGLPRGMSLLEITRTLAAVEGVVDVHDLHVWSLGSDAHALSCHVLIEDMPPSESNSILERIQKALCSFHIHHSTVQFEHVKCALSESPCSMSTPAQPHSHEHPHSHPHAH